MVKNKVLIWIGAGIGLLLLAACSPGTPAVSPSASTAKTEVAAQTVPGSSPSPSTTQNTLQSSPTIALDKEIEPLSPDFSQMSKLTTIGDKFKFIEGPAWDAAGKFLLFSDIDANRIYQLALPGTITVFRDPSNKSNGLTFDTSGCLLAAEHGSRSVTRTLKDGTIETLAGSYQGKQLNSPNDITLKNDGTIYFTDPNYGLERRQPGVDFMGLYRLKKSGEVVLEGKFDKSPNGLVFSPDQKILYLALTTGNQVMAFDAAEDCSIQGGRVFVTVPQPDGMTIDRSGNLYVAGLEGVYIFSPSGSQLGLIKTGHQPTNCEFGGINRTTLFITAREELYSVESPIPGF
jgi:gluconolactonase